jgi:hypothetical protein
VSTKAASVARYVTVVGTADELGNNAELTEAGKDAFVQWFRRHYVDDASATLDASHAIEDFAKDEIGFPVWGDDYAVDFDHLLAALASVGIKHQEHGLLLARPRDALGVQFGRFLTSGPRSDLVAGIIPCASVGLVVGEAGTLKSWLLASLAVSVAHDAPWLGKHATGGTPDVRRVVYVNFDMPAATLDTRLVYCGDDGRVGRCNYPGLSPAEPEFWIELEKAMRPALVIIDTLGGATPGASERDATFALPLKLARRYANKVDGAVLFAHHSGKEIDGAKTVSSVVRGTSALGGDVDVAYHLELLKAAGPKERRARVSCVKFRDGADVPAPFVLQLVDGKIGILGSETDFADELLSAIRANPGVCVSTLARTLGKRKELTLETADELVVAGKLRSEISGRTKALYIVD